MKKVRFSTNSILFVICLILIIAIAILILFDKQTTPSGGSRQHIAFSRARKEFDSENAGYILYYEDEGGALVKVDGFIPWELLEYKLFWEKNDDFTLYRHEKITSKYYLALRYDLLEITKKDRTLFNKTFEEMKKAYALEYDENPNQDLGDIEPKVDVDQKRQIIEEKFLSAYYSELENKLSEEATTNLKSIYNQAKDKHVLKSSAYLVYYPSDRINTYIKVDYQQDSYSIRRIITNPIYLVENGVFFRHERVADKYYLSLAFESENDLSSEGIRLFNQTFEQMKAEIKLEIDVDNDEAREPLIDPDCYQYVMIEDTKGIDSGDCQVIDG